MSTWPTCCAGRWATRASRAADKDPANWPDLMRREWAGDGGTAAAAGHRKELPPGWPARGRALDAFQPDVVLVWGDDQYENFREEVVPPFCVLGLRRDRGRPVQA